VPALVCFEQVGKHPIDVSLGISNDAIHLGREPRHRDFSVLSISFNDMARNLDLRRADHGEWRQQSSNIECSSLYSTGAAASDMMRRSQRKTLRAKTSKSVSFPCVQLAEQTLKLGDSKPIL